MSVMFQTAVAYGYHSPLVSIRKRTALKRTSDKDRLGLNATQYSKEIPGPYLRPLLSKVAKSLLRQYYKAKLRALKVFEDSATCHTAKCTRLYRLEHEITRLPWPASSPDLNLIKNRWALLKSSLCRQWRNLFNWLHYEQESIVNGQGPQEQLPWARIYKWYNDMPTRVLTVLRRGERSTKQQGQCPGIFYIVQLWCIAFIRPCGPAGF